MVQSLVERHGRDTIETALLFVYFSQGGIFEFELQRLMMEREKEERRAAATAGGSSGGSSSSEEIGSDGAEDWKLTIMESSFSLMYQHLQSLLPTNSSGLLQFFHNDMRTLIFRMFLGGEGLSVDHLQEGSQQKQFDILTEEEREKGFLYHRLLGQFYMRQVLDDENYDLRTLRVATYHLEHAGLVMDLKSVLLKPFAFSAMFKSELRGELFRLWLVVVTHEADGVLAAATAMETAAVAHTHGSSASSDPPEPGSREELVRQKSELIDEYYKVEIKENFDPEDPSEEAAVYSLLGEFFTTDEVISGLHLNALSATYFYRQVCHRQHLYFLALTFLQPCRRHRCLLIQMWIFETALPQLSRPYQIFY
jgi:hypothetical protein